ncbi:MAG: PQQ-dependent sugar dehydrogenase [Acidimicrobiia bacterium]
MIPAKVGALALSIVAALPSCGGGDEGDATGRILVPRADEAAALAALPGGGLLFGERATGRVMRAGRSGRVDRQPVARLAVSTEGQRGLLGLATDGTGRVFAAWTEPAADRRLMVGQVAPGPVRPVWEGPPSQKLANGGHIAFAPDGGLVVGVGDLLEPERIDDPAFPHGKLLRLDPEGPATQSPTVISGGWNNPFAFTFDTQGRLWVADNAPGEEPERLVRGDLGPGRERAAVLPSQTAPSGLAAAEDHLIVCGFLTGELLTYGLAGSGVPDATGRSLAEDCRLGVVTLTDGRLAYATAGAIRVLPASVLP